MARVGFYELENGMDLVVHRDPDANEFHFLFGAKMGSEKEGVKRIEGAHLLEHLFFQSNGLERTLSLLHERANRGIRTQGETSHGHVYGFFSGPTRQMRYIMETAYESLMNNQHDLAQFEREKRIITIEGKSMKNNQGVRMDEVMLSYLYPGTRYALTFDELISHIPALTLTKTLDLKRQLFRPSNMTLVAIGNKDADTINAIANETFGKLPKSRKLTPYRPALSTPEPFIVETSDRGIHTCHVRHVFRAGSDSLPNAKERMARLYLLHSALGAGNEYDTSFLYQNLRLKTGRSYVPEATIVEGPPEQLLQIDYDCEEQDIEPNIYNITQILSLLASKRLSPALVKTYANFAVNEFNKETADVEEELAKWYLGNSANGVMMSTKEFKQLIRSVSPERLRRTAEELMPDMGTFVFRPAPDPITTVTSVNGVPVNAQPAFGNSSSLPVVGADGAPGSSTSSSPDSTILNDT